MFDTLKRRAKASVKTQRGACIAFALIFLAVFPILDFSAYNLSILFRRYSSDIIFLEYIAILVFYAWLNMGEAIFFLNLSKRRSNGFSDVLDGFENIFKAIALMFLTWLFILLWSVLFIVPGIMALYRYRAAFYILAECPELSPLDAIRISKNMMQGRKMRLFLMDLSFIGWLLLTAVTLGIAGLYAIPYYCAANTEFYRSVKADYIDSQNGAASEEREPEGAETKYRNDSERRNHTWEHNTAKEL